MLPSSLPNARGSQTASAGGTQPRFTETVLRGPRLVSRMGEGGVADVGSVYSVEPDGSLQGAAWGSVCPVPLLAFSLPEISLWALSPTLAPPPKPSQAWEVGPPGRGPGLQPPSLL